MSISLFPRTEFSVTPVSVVSSRANTHTHFTPDHQHHLFTSTYTPFQTHTHTHCTYETVEHGAGDAVDPAHGEKGQGSVAPETCTRRSSFIGKTILPSPAALAAFSSLSHTHAVQTHPSCLSVSLHTHRLPGQGSSHRSVKEVRKYELA